MNYVFKMGSGAMIHIKIGSGVQKLMGGIHIQTHTHTDSKVFSYA
jgi:gentisate 1,2-dioxygenase